MWQNDILACSFGVANCKFKESQDDMRIKPKDVWSVEQTPPEMEHSSTQRRPTNALRGRCEQQFAFRHSQPALWLPGTPALSAQRPSQRAGVQRGLSVGRRGSPLGGSWDPSACRALCSRSPDHPPCWQQSRQPPLLFPAYVLQDDSRQLPPNPLSRWATEVYTRGLR